MRVGVTTMMGHRRQSRWGITTKYQDSHTQVSPVKRQVQTQSCKFRLPGPRPVHFLPKVLRRLDGSFQGKTMLIEEHRSTLVFKAGTRIERRLAPDNTHLGNHHRVPIHHHRLMSPMSSSRLSLYNKTWQPRGPNC